MSLWAKLSIHSIYIPTLTYSHELWLVTKRMRSPRQAAEISFNCGPAVPGCCSFTLHWLTIAKRRLQWWLLRTPVTHYYLLRYNMIIPDHREHRSGQFAANSTFKQCFICHPHPHGCLGFIFKPVYIPPELTVCMQGDKSVVFQPHQQ